MPLPPIPPSRKTQIDRTATALFRARGYAATTMRELATELRMEAGSLYSHIKSKEEILHRVCFALAEDFFMGFAAATSAPAAMSAPAAPLATQLRLAIEAHVRVLTRDSAASAVFLHEWRHLSEPARTEFLALRDRYEAGFRGLIQRGIAAGELRAPDAAFAALTLLGSLNWLPTWYRPEGQLSPDEIAHRLAEQLMRGLAAAG